MADIKIKASPDEIQQVLGGAAPGAAAPPPMPPPPPPPPMPTPAQAGYRAFASDPMNQSAVSKHLSTPDTPILPPAPAPMPMPVTGTPQTAVLPAQAPPAGGAAAAAPPAASSAVLPPGLASSDPGNAPQMASLSPPRSPMASLNPPAAAASAPPPSIYGGAAPAAPTATPQTAMLPSQQGSTPAPLTVNPYGTPTQAEYFAMHPGDQARKQFSGGGVVQNLLNGIAAGTLGAAGGLKGDPGLGAQWVAQGAARDAQVPEVNASRYRAGVVQPLEDAAKLEDTQSQTAQRNADAKKKDQQTDDMAPFVMSPAQASAINQPALAGTTATMRDYNRLLGMAGNNNTSAANNKTTNDTKVTTTGLNNDSKESIAATRAATQKAMSDATNKTRALVAAMHDQTSRANNANTVSSRTGGGAPGPGGTYKVPADVTKRAALASNVLENADAVDGIITRRPDIIGAAGGRYSNVQQMIGSDDPDIQALGVRMHNMALASNGAHGVRSQQAIQKTEDELFSNFKAGPNAIRGALGATRGSMQTFLNDEQNFATTGSRMGAGAKPNNMVPPRQGGSIPDAAAAQLTEGQQHTFNNGQVWTKQGGKPVRIK